MTATISMQCIESPPRNKVKRNPKQAEEHGNLAYVYANSPHGDLELARLHAMKAVMLDPDRKCWKENLHKFMEQKELPPMADKKIDITVTEFTPEVDSIERTTLGLLLEFGLGKPEGYILEEVDKLDSRLHALLLHRDKLSQNDRSRCLQAVFKLQEMIK